MVLEKVFVGKAQDLECEVEIEDIADGIERLSYEVVEIDFFAEEGGGTVIALPLEPVVAVLVCDIEIDDECADQKAEDDIEEFEVLHFVLKSKSI